MKNRTKEKALIRKATEAMENSYSPYSSFPVGAALLVEDGEIFTGTNVENASLGLSICAERAAIVSAVTKGHRKFEAIAIVGKERGVTPPCGTCRQFMAEFGNFEVILAGTDELVRTTVFELLPLRFELKK